MVAPGSSSPELDSRLLTFGLQSIRLNSRLNHGNCVFAA